MIAKDIPRNEASKLAREFGYDQLIIIGRRIGEQGAECVIGHGSTTEHVNVVKDLIHKIKFGLLKWPE